MHCTVLSLRANSAGRSREGMESVNEICHLGGHSVQLLSCVRLFATPWTAARQASLSITNSQSFLKLMSIELVMPSNHFILCCPLLLLPSIFPSIRVFSNELVFRVRWPKYWSFSSASVQFSSVAQSCLTVCNPLDCSTPGFLVHHQFSELAQTHVH